MPYCTRCGSAVDEGDFYCRSCGHPVAHDPAAAATAHATAADVERQLLYAGFWRRLGALLIDSVILVVFDFTLIGILAASSASTSVQEAVLLSRRLAGNDLLLYGIGWLYYSIFESSSRQATPGKLVFGIAVTDTEGNRISFGRATGRYLAKNLSAISLLIGYLMAGFTKRKQALHDLIAGTLVIRKEIA